MENNDFGFAMEFWAKTVGTAFEAAAQSVKENAVQVAERLNGPEFKGKLAGLFRNKAHSFMEYLSRGDGVVPNLMRRLGFVKADTADRLFGDSGTTEIKSVKMNPEEIRQRREKLAELRKRHMERRASAQSENQAPAEASGKESKDAGLEAASKRVADNGDRLKSEIDAIRKNPFAVFNIEKSVSEVNGKISEYLSVNGKDLSAIGDWKSSVDPETMKRISAQITELSSNLNKAANHPKLPADARKDFAAHAASIDAIRAKLV